VPEGGRRILAEAPRAEVGACIAAFVNGKLAERPEDPQLAEAAAANAA